MHDRTGEPFEADHDHDAAAAHRARCSGWLGEDDDGRLRPCLRCKSHLRAGYAHGHDYAEATPSARAQAAIDRDNRRNP